MHDSGAGRAAPRPGGVRERRSQALASFVVVEHFAVRGGARLAGSVDVVGAKNSVLKLMAAALLARGTTTITNCPEILDVPLMADVLRSLGCAVTVAGGTVTIDVPPEPGAQADYRSVSKLRASVCVLGPLVARCRRAVVPLPGGDAIGSRPLDMHQAGLRKLGATTEIEHGRVVAEAADLHGAQIWLDFPSVGATENILMAAVLADGTTVIDNAAREPEIVDLCTMLQQMGAKIDGVGSSTLTVHGVTALQPTEHRVIGDRIVGATWAFAAAVTRGSVTVRGVDPHHLDLVLDKLRTAGAEITVGMDDFTVAMDGRPRAVDFVTLPYPGFATDLQPMAIALAAVADGTSMITENVFEARFRFVDEMVRLGADARTDGHHAVVRGVERLSSAPVWASDIRAGAGLVLAGLCADGTTEVWDIEHIDRGYPRFVENLRALGADVGRVAADPER
jgi:UDP-N-acetylglucosamine 1-carboxyvinyltransferase